MDGVIVRVTSCSCTPRLNKLLTLAVRGWGPTARLDFCIIPGVSALRH